VWKKVVDKLRVDELNPDAVPQYLVQYYVQHLYESQASIDYFVPLLQRGWLRAWLLFDGGYRGYARDVSRRRQGSGQSQDRREAAFCPKISLSIDPQLNLQHRDADPLGNPYRRVQN